MSDLIIALVILACTCSGLLLTMSLRHRLPPHHEEDATRDLIKIATGMLATLVALILGLLVNSAKTTFDTATAEVTQIGARIITLDRTLQSYGPETQPVRQLLRSDLAGQIATIWPGTTGQRASVNRDDSPVLDEVGKAIRKLSPQNQPQALAQAKAIDQAAELARIRWLLFEQMQNPLPQVFLFVLAFWLIQLFIGLGLLAPLNSTSVIALVTCAASMSAAIFLILEMNHPLDGIIDVSSAPLEAALAVISK